jgi:hypothetical protein
MILGGGGGDFFLMEGWSRRKLGGIEGKRTHFNRYYRCPGGVSNRAYRLLPLHNLGAT